MSITEQEQPGTAWVDGGVLIWTGHVRKPQRAMTGSREDQVSIRVERADDYPEAMPDERLLR